MKIAKRSDNEQGILNTFEKLVALDSPSRKERPVAEFIKKELSQLDVVLKEDQAGEKIGGSTGNIIAELPAADSRHDAAPLLLLSAHMDKVQPGTGTEMQILENYITAAGDNILGADDLAGVAAILEALKRIESKKASRGPLKLIFSVAEEEGLQGAQNMDPDLLQNCDYGIVVDSEGAVGKIVYRAPFKIGFNARIKGQKAHSGINPDGGVNAIKIASLAISAMELGRIGEQTTANIGVIKGGVARNVVPDFIELQGEVRSHDKSKLRQQTEHMKAMIQKYTAEYGGEVEFDIELLYKGYSVSRNSPFVNFLVQTAESLNLPVEFAVSGGGSDANVFNAHGLPVVNLGTGFENAHSAAEKIKIDNLFKLVDFLESIIQNIGSDSNRIQRKND